MFVDFCSFLQMGTYPGMVLYFQAPYIQAPTGAAPGSCFSSGCDEQPTDQSSGLGTRFVAICIRRLFRADGWPQLREHHAPSSHGDNALRRKREVPFFSPVTIQWRQHPKRARAFVPGRTFGELICNKRTLRLRFWLSPAISGAESSTCWLEYLW